MHPDRQQQIEKLAELIREIKIAMLTTVTADGRLLSRPLGTQDVDFDGDLWFATGLDSAKAREVAANPAVNVSYASMEENTFVSVAGRATLVRDRATIERFWSPAMQIYFPAGKDDPNLALIRVEALSAEYWDGPGSLIGKALHFVMAAANDDPGALGDNETLSLRHG